jgi:hypothetical protein
MKIQRKVVVEVVVLPYCSIGFPYSLVVVVDFQIVAVVPSVVAPFSYSVRMAIE